MMPPVDDRPTCTMRYTILSTFTGPFVVYEDEQGRLRTSWRHAGLEPRIARGHRDDALRPDVVAALRAYFDGEPASFDHVPTPDGAAFRRCCWEACRRIPPGETRAYGELARLAGGSPGAARAAGQAMRHNPLPIVVPCHRVIAASGRLHGFAGSDDPGGEELAVKLKLLDHEGAAAPTLFR